MNGNSFARLVGGGLGGLAGALAAHLAVLGSYRLSPAAGLWLKGPHGPPFASLALHTAVFYGLLGAGVATGARQRLCAGLWACGSGFLALALPMALATRVFAWGEDPAQGETLAWFYWVLAVYTAASLGAVWLIGARCSGPRVLAGWKTGLGAVSGTVAAYLAGRALAAFLPALWRPLAFGLTPWPPMGALIEGIVTGVLLGLGIVFAETRAGDRAGSESRRVYA